MSGEDWLFQFPAFLDRLREVGAQGVLETIRVPLGGVLYHHRGVRVPGYDATFVWHPAGSDNRDGEHGGGDRGGDGPTFELVVDGVDDRAAWATFDAEREWDFFLAQPPDDAAYVAWMSDDEFETEEADEFTRKADAVGLGRFSFGLYLQPRDAWAELEERVAGVDAPCFVYRPGGRTLVPEGDLAAYDEVVPPELLGGTAPAHLGLQEAELGRR